MSDFVKVMDKPNQVTATFRITATAEYYCDDATVEWLRNDITEALDGMFSDVDVALAEPKTPNISQAFDKVFFSCRRCGKSLVTIADKKGLKAFRGAPKFCSECGQEVQWNDKS